MKIKHGMILAAGLGKRMHPITLKTPKPLIQIGNKNLIERAIKLLINHGIEEIVINVHYLPDQIKNFIKKKNYQVKIMFSDEQDTLLDTGGGILHATRSFIRPFVAINPDTLWRDAYRDELKKLEDLYFKKKKPCLLLVKKSLSFDNTFKGDFNLQDGVISRDNINEYIFTGLQILDQTVFNFINDKIFSMNKIWNHLIEKNYLTGTESKQKFYHLNTKEMYDKLLNLKSID